jgi:tetratricopeptide (TPR) repeat protein
LEVLLARAKQALVDKDYPLALRTVEAARALAPTDATVLELLTQAQTAAESAAADSKAIAAYKAAMNAGLAALDAGRLTDAIKEFEAALLVRPADADATAGRKQAEAKLAALKNREKREAAFDALISRARTASTAKRYSEAITSYEAALRVFPDDRDAGNALRLTKDALKKAKKEYAGLLAKAEGALRLGKAKEAARLFDDAAGILPEDTAAAKGRRNAESLVDNTQNAVTSYLTLMLQGKAALEAGSYAEAVVAYAAALRLRPTDVEAARRLKQAKAALDQIAIAQADFDQLMKTGVAALKRRAFADAEFAFSQALKLSPGDAGADAGFRKARYGRTVAEGRKAMLLGNRTDAIKAFELALEAKPGDATATAGLRQAKAMR